MKFSVFYPVLLGIAVAGSLIFYNETNDDILTKQLSLRSSYNDSFQESKIRESDQEIESNPNEINEETVISNDQADLVKNADYILEKARYIQTLDSVEEINISEKEYNNVLSAFDSLEIYVKSFYQNPNVNTLNLSQKDIEKIQNAYSFAPTIISLIDSAKKIQNNNYDKCDDQLINALKSCSPYTCEVYDSDLGILSPYKVLGENAIGNCGYSYTYNKLPFVCGLNTNQKHEVMNSLADRLEKNNRDLSLAPDNLPAGYTSIEGESSKQLEGCIMITLGGQLEQFKKS